MINVCFDIVIIILTRKDDKDAAEKFVRIAKAYETLKDPDSRKQYDLHGEEGSSSNKNHQYHSYTYYRDQFGIYDDDPLIVTLSRVDYGMYSIYYIIVLLFCVESILDECGKW